MSQSANPRTERSPGTDRRPVRRCDDVIISQHTEFHDRSRINFITPRAGGPLVFGEEELFLFLALDGRTSYSEIEHAFAARFKKRLSPREFERFLYQLYDLGLVETLEASGSGTAEARPGYLDYVEPEPFVQHVPWAVRLCDPSLLLRAIAWLGRPVKYGLWLLAPAVYLAWLILYRYQGPLLSDLQAIASNVSVYAIIVFALLVGLAARLVQGAVATAHGAEIRALGMSAFLGVLPRFLIDDTPIQRLPRSGMLWCYAAPLLFRLFLFAAGTFVWITYRGNANSFYWVGLLCAQLGLWTALLSLLPLLPGDSYRWMSTYLGDPNLRRRSFQLLHRLARGLPVPNRLSSAERWGFFLFGSLSILATCALALAGFIFVGQQMITAYQGTGMALWTGLFVLAIAWLLCCLRKKDVLIGLNRSLHERLLPAGPESIDETGR